jgi:hypothetical protein
VKTSAGTGKVMKVNPLTGILEVYIEGEKNLLSCKTADVVVLQQGDSGLDVSDVPIEATAAEIAAIVDEDIPIPEASNDSYSVSTRQNRFQPVDNEPANMRRNDNRPRQDNRPQNDYRGNRPNTDTNNTNRPTPPPANVPPPQHPQRRRIIEPESSQEYEQMRKAQNQQNSGGPGNAPRPNNGPNRNQNPNPNAPRNNQNRPNNNFRRNRNDQGGNV